MRYSFQREHARSHRHGATRLHSGRISTCIVASSWAFDLASFSRRSAKSCEVVGSAVTRWDQRSPNRGCRTTFLALKCLPSIRTQRAVVGNATEPKAPHRRATQIYLRYFVANLWAHPGVWRANKVEFGTRRHKPTSTRRSATYWCSGGLAARQIRQLGNGHGGQ